MSYKNGYEAGEEFVFSGFSTLAEHKSKVEKSGKSSGPVMVWDMLPYTKLLFMRDIGRSEVGGYAVTAKNDPLHVIDFFLVDQDSNAAFCKFSDIGVSDFNMDMAMGLKGYADYTGDNYLAIWVHTHPGDSAHPSGTDFNTFSSPSFTGRAWAVMFILSRGGQVSSRLRCNSSPIPDMPATPVIDLDSWMPARDFLKLGELHGQWTKEYESLVRTEGVVRSHGSDVRGSNSLRNPMKIYSQREGRNITQREWDDVRTDWDSRYADWDKPTNFKLVADNGVEADPISLDAFEIEEELSIGSPALIASMGSSDFHAKFPCETEEEEDDPFSEARQIDKFLRNENLTEHNRLVALQAEIEKLKEPKEIT